MYERALTADPNDANILGNYARLDFSVGHDSDGLAKVTKALEIAAGQPRYPYSPSATSPCSRMSHPPRVGAGVRLRQLMDDGMSTGTWEF